MATDTITDGWHAARLIPTAGIKGQEEQEKRATSSLLAVMRAVPEFATRCSRSSGRRKVGSRPTPRCG